MADVPNTTTFSLSDVTNVVGGQSLTDAFAYANSAGFDPSYVGTCNCLLSFRNYCNAVWKTVDFCVYQDYNYGTSWRKCVCLVVNPPMVSGEEFYFCVAADANTDSYDSYNGCAFVYDCTYSYINVYTNCSMPFCSCENNLYFSYGGQCTFELMAQTEYGCSNYANMNMLSVTPITGCFCTNYSSVYVYVPAY